eukprot:Transcript_10657.p3 GENE.Transcript_10657~~Transcript_10657.p3  ORF type:complete len:160 (-),score=18.34 Transcript_10657:585-1004(-)
MATTTHRAPWQQTMDRSGRTSEVVRVSIGMGDASDLNLSTVRGVQLGEAIKKDEAARPSGHVKGYVPVIDISTGDYVALINYYSKSREGGHFKTEIVLPDETPIAELVRCGSIAPRTACQRRHTRAQLARRAPTATHSA